MKFDVIIGNPPYQDNTIGKNDSYAPPVYNLFLDASYNIANVVEMIHPARFLFNAGSTPKDWNKRMLNDEHLKVLRYEPNSKKIFQNTDIMGGIAITYRDTKHTFGKIGLFTASAELNSIYKKIFTSQEFKSMSDIIYAAESYHFTETLHAENPSVGNMLSKGHRYDLKSNVLDKLSNVVFFDVRKEEYIGIMGRKDTERKMMYIDKRYMTCPDNFEKYKILLPNANGSPALGEAQTSLIGQPIIGKPFIGHTQTFLSIGKFETEKEANNCMKFIKTKFARAMVGLLKVTQSNSRPVWKFVPLQDFTNKSDIDWSKSIKEIDQQLYKKYGLDENEINFIETRVKEMA